MKLFYSWQSDIPTNRTLINRCLRNVIETVEEVELETATRNSIGSPDIASTIFAKIDQSQMIIADVTIINHRTRSGRKSPNPNVMYELGYAVKAMGEQNVILIANSQFTNTANLPFDIRNRRMILIDFSSENAQNIIASNIRTALGNYTPNPPDNEVPTASLNEPDMTWASNYSGYGASFRGVISIDNYGGGSNYITNVQLVGTNADGSQFTTDRFTFEGQQPNYPKSIAPDEMPVLTVFVSYDHQNHRPMPDLDRDTVKLILELRSGKVIELPVHIRQS